MDIAKDKVYQEFQSWGKLYTVEFEIIPTNLPLHGVTNVFNFNAAGTVNQYGQGSYGARTPGLFIFQGGFSICSAVNGNWNNCANDLIEIESGKHYQITIKQFKDSEAYWYEIIINGESKLLIENKQPQHFSSVKLYTSDPWHDSFSTDMGKICNFMIQNDEG